MACCLRHFLQKEQTRPGSSSPDLLIMGTYGMGTVGRLLMGSVARGVARPAPFRRWCHPEPIVATASRWTDRLRTLQVDGTE